MMIRFNKPTIKRKDMDSVLQTMVNEQIGSGDQVIAFCSSFASLVGCSNAVGFRTYPDCIRYSFKFSGVNQESVVAVSPLTPSIYLDVIKEIGCRYVLVDCNKENGLPDEESVANSGADFLVLYENCGSLPLKYDQQQGTVISADYGNISVIEDVSESIGSYYAEYKAGNWGNVVVCSFEQENVISVGGGAGLAVKNATVESLNELQISDYLKMTDMGAALGNVQIDNLEENCAKRREIKEMYNNGLRTTNHKMFGLNVLDYKPCAGSFAVFMDCKTDDIIKFAEKHDVPVLKTFCNSISKDYEGDLFEVCPVAASYYHRTISFPIYPFLKSTEIDIIAKIISHLP